MNIDLVNLAYRAIEGIEYHEGGAVKNPGVFNSNLRAQFLLDELRKLNGDDIAPYLECTTTLNAPIVEGDRKIFKGGFHKIVMEYPFDCDKSESQNL